MHILDEPFDEAILVPSEEVLVYLERECARMSPVVAAALAWSHATDALLRERAAKRLRHALSVFAADHMVS